MPIRVFLVEDLPHLQDIVADLLGTVGDFTVAGRHATEAEARLWLQENAGGWDLAVIDLILAQGTGMGVITHARRLHPQGRVAVFSDYATPGIRAHCLKLGADAVFLKSHETPQFLAWCESVARP